MSAQQPLPCGCFALQQRWLKSRQRPHFVLPEQLSPPPGAPRVMHSDVAALREVRVGAPPPAEAELPKSPPGATSAAPRA